MIFQAGGPDVEIDTGTNHPGVLLRLDGDRWKPYLQNGKPINWPVKLESLPPGRYRVQE